MGSIHTKVPVKEAQLVATVIRADGTIEELGTIAYYHQNPLKRLVHRLKKLTRIN